MADVDPDRMRSAIQALIDGEIDALNGDLPGWRERCRTALRVTFGESDPLLARFDAISFRPTPEEIESEGHRGWARGSAVSGGASRIVAMLQGALFELDLRQDERVLDVDEARRVEEA